jgi:hypothetical protein
LRSNFVKGPSTGSPSTSNNSVPGGSQLKTENTQNQQDAVAGPSKAQPTAAKPFTEQTQTPPLLQVLSNHDYATKTVEGKTLSYFLFF